MQCIIIKICYYNNIHLYRYQPDRSKQSYSFKFKQQYFHFKLLLQSNGINDSDANESAKQSVKYADNNSFSIKINL